MKNNNCASLTWEENAYLFKQLENGDLSAREKIINGNINLVYAVMAKNNFKYNEDLFQEGIIGLLKAIDTFDVNRNIKFSTYAFKYILTEIRRVVDQTNEEKLQRKILSYVEEVYKIRGIKPTSKEISEELNIEEVYVEYLMGLKFSETSIDKPVKEDGESLLQLLFSKDNIEKEVLDKIYLENIFEILTVKEKEILLYKYGFTDGECWTFEKISKLYGVSREAVRQTENKILNKIRTSSKTKVKSISNYVKK